MRYLYRKITSNTGPINKILIASSTQNTTKLPGNKTSRQIMILSRITVKTGRFIKWGVRMMPERLLLLRNPD